MVVNHTLSQLAMIRRILSWSIPKFRQNAAVPNAYNTRPHLLPLNISYTGFQVAPVNSLFSHRFHPSSYLESFAGGVFRAHHTLTRPRGVTSALSPPPRPQTHNAQRSQQQPTPKPSRLRALTHVLVHVEGFHVLEGEVPVPAVLHQLLVAAQRRAPCGEAAASAPGRAGKGPWPPPPPLLPPRPRYPPVGSPSVKNRPGPGPNWTMRLRMYLAAHSLACAYVSRMTSFMAGAELRRAATPPSYTVPLPYLPARSPARPGIPTAALRARPAGGRRAPGPAPHGGGRSRARPRRIAGQNSGLEWK